MINKSLSYLFVLIISIGAVTAAANEEFQPLHDDIQVMMEAGQPGTVFKATIVAVKVWMGADGDHTMHFTLTDGTKWHTVQEGDFKTAIRGNWTIGDPVTIKGVDGAIHWEAYNHRRNSTINLYAE